MQLSNTLLGYLAHDYLWKKVSNHGWRCPDVELQSELPASLSTLLMQQSLPGAPSTLSVSSGHQWPHRDCWNIVVPSRSLPHLPYLLY